jgi:hypothetical protein
MGFVFTWKEREDDVAFLLGRTHSEMQLVNYHICCFVWMRLSLKWLLLFSRVIIFLIVGKVIVAIFAILIRPKGFEVLNTKMRS